VVNELNLILPTPSDAFKVQEFVLDDEGNAKKKRHHYSIFFQLLPLLYPSKGKQKGS
jgi:hypothetical protein